MIEPERRLNNNSNLIRLVLVLWVVAVWVVAIGTFLLAFHLPRTEDRMVSRWHEPPPSMRRAGRPPNCPARSWFGAPTSGSSTAPDMLSKRQ